MKKIVFVNQDAGYLMIDIVNSYAAKGYECVLMTGRLVIRNTKLNPNVKQIKIKTYNRHGFVQRFYSWTFAFVRIFLLVKFKYRGYELFVVSNPPFATHLSLYVSNQIKLLIYDIYPDAITEMGMLSEKSIIIKIWRWLNKKSYGKVEKIYTLTDGMKKVLGRYADDNKIQKVPIWTDNDFFKPIDRRNNKFAAQYSLEDKFVVLYSGNVGLNNQLESLMYVAEELKQSENILFLIIGNGDKKGDLEILKSQLQLANVMFLDWQKPENLPYSLSVADVSVVSLDARASKLAIPSKLYNYMSVGSALLCIAPEDSELSSLMKKYNAGFCFEAAQTSDMAQYILKLSKDYEELNRLKLNAIAATKDFSVENVNLFF